MAQHSLSDRVAIVSMGCTRFAEHFDRSADQLTVDAVDPGPNMIRAAQRRVGGFARIMHDVIVGTGGELPHYRSRQHLLNAVSICLIHKRGDRNRLNILRQLHDVPRRVVTTSRAREE